MEHAKKLMLVNPANFDLRNVKRRYSELDQNISDVLDRQDVDDYDKSKLYQSALSKFLANRQVVENELNEPLKVSVAEPSDVNRKNKYEQFISDLVSRLSSAEKKAYDKDDSIEGPSLPSDDETDWSTQASRSRTRLEKLPTTTSTRSTTRGRLAVKSLASSKRSKRKPKSKRLSPTWVTFKSK